MDAVGGEAKAFEVGISYARDVGVAEFILEGDSLIISHALCELWSCEQSSPPSSIGPIVNGILSSSHDFQHIEFFHVRRQGNRLLIC